VFKNRVLRMIFGPKRDEVTGEWRRLHTGELYGKVLLAKYFSSYQIKNNEMGGVCSNMGKRICAYRVSIAKPEGKRPLGRHKR
jgi:hypothetical protein